MALNMLAPFEFVVYQAISIAGQKAPIGIVQSIIKERINIDLGYQEIHMVMMRGIGKGLLRLEKVPYNRYPETRHRCGYTLTPPGRRLLKRTQKLLGKIQGENGNLPSQ